MNKILITGATGQFGSATVEHLLKKIPASDLAVMVRSAQKGQNFKDKGIDIRIADYDDVSSMQTAFNGIDILLFVSANDLENRTVQQKRVMEAIKNSAIKYVVYTSFERKNETESSPIAFVADAHIVTEKLLKESGLDYTILRNNLYLDVLPMFLGEKVLENKTIYFPAGQGKGAFAARADLAEATANILTSDGHKNKIYDFANTEKYDFVGIASTLSSLLDAEVKYISPEKEVFANELQKMKVPQPMIDMSVGFAEAIKQGEFDSAGTDLEAILGHKPTSLKDFLKATYNL